MNSCIDNWENRRYPSRRLVGLRERRRRRVRRAPDIINNRIDEGIDVLAKHPDQRIGSVCSGLGLRLDVELDGRSFILVHDGVYVIGQIEHLVGGGFFTCEWLLAFEWLFRREARCIVGRFELDIGPGVRGTGRSV